MRRAQKTPVHHHKHVATLVDGTLLFILFRFLSFFLRLPGYVNKQFHINEKATKEASASPETCDNPEDRVMRMAPC